MAGIIGERVLLERRSLDLTQEDLGGKVGVERSYISAIEHNKAQNVGTQIVFALATALGVSPQYLLGFTDDPLAGIAEEEEDVSPPPAVVHDPPADYTTADPRLRQLLVDVISRLDEQDQTLLLQMANRLRHAATPRIIGDE